MVGGTGRIMVGQSFCTQTKHMLTVRQLDTTFIEPCPDSDH